MKEKLFTSSLLALLIIAAVSSVFHITPVSFGYPGTNVYIDPPTIDMYTNVTGIGDTFTIQLKYGNMTDLAGMEYKLYWRNALLNCTNVHDSLPWGGSPFVAANTTDNAFNATHGYMYFSVVSLSGSVNGSSNFRNATFSIINVPPVGYGNFLSSAIGFGPYGSDTIFGDSGANLIPADVYNSEFLITNPGPVPDFDYIPTNPGVNDTVTFNASSSYVAGGGTITSYEWDFGDTNSGTGVTADHAFTSAGDYLVNLTVTDNQARTNSIAKTVHVTAGVENPVANFTYSPQLLDGGVKVNTTITFDASASHDPDGTIANYTWDFGDGNITSLTSPTITHVYTALGDYTIVLTVFDDMGLNSTMQMTITVWPESMPSPVADFTYSPSMPSVSYATTFDATSTNASGALIMSYAWDFGDANVTTTEPTIEHVYTTAGTYDVSLTVMNNYGDSDTKTETITVYPAIGWLEVQPSQRLVLNEEFNVNITVNHLGEEWHTFGLEFNLAFDSTYIEFISATEGPFWADFGWATEPPYTFTYAVRHTGYVSVYITLLGGGNMSSGYMFPNGDGVVATVKFRTTSAVAMHTSYALPFTISGAMFGNYTGYEVPHYDSFGADWYIRIDSPVPMFDYMPKAPVTGEAITFNASDSYVTSPFEGVTIVSYGWDFGDGSSGTDIIASHVYGELGTYEVMLTVTDSNGNSRSLTMEVTVSRWYIDVQVSVGTIHFRGEIAEFYIETSIWGKPVDITSVTATLYHGSGQTSLTSLVQNVGTGLYRISYSIPTDAATGTYAAVVEVNYAGLSGTSMDTFEISSTLTDWNARLTTIEGDIATIKTDIGIIKTNLTTINAHLTSISNGIATIETDIGIVKANLTAINASVVNVDDNVATVRTDLGMVKTSVDSLKTDVGAVQNKLPTDTGTIATLLYVAIVFALLSMIVSVLVYLMIKKKTS